MPSTIGPEGTITTPQGMASQAFQISDNTKNRRRKQFLAMTADRSSEETENYPNSGSKKNMLSRLTALVSESRIGYPLRTRKNLTASIHLSRRLALAKFGPTSSCIEAQGKYRRIFLMSSEGFHRWTDDEMKRVRCELFQTIEENTDIADELAGHPVVRRSNQESDRRIHPTSIPLPNLNGQQNDMPLRSNALPRPARDGITTVEGSETNIDNLEQAPILIGHFRSSESYFHFQGESQGGQGFTTSE
ncbi:uncharacterized protein RCO7_14870 [Rhynchosporium graminicola]|uniref:Uncharacterized protein n=1 Tax=Rhynchosporium graminicola TaxID=2792576 RepID=A0A1E1L6U6_9HELO|nr:uncharacterized protein RCO7_14870 [Rhynchosporium commune]